jgi:hypothetical protein
MENICGLLFTSYKVKSCLVYMKCTVRKPTSVHKNSKNSILTFIPNENFKYIHNTGLQLTYKRLKIDRENIVR